MAFFFLGGIFYVCLLLVNALAVLNEERFLARSTLPICVIRGVLIPR